MYISPGSIKWGKDKYYDSVIVRDRKDYDKYFTEGYVGSLHEALFVKKVNIEKPTWKELAKECGLEGEELKKFMKKNTEQKKKQLEKLKEG